MRVRDMTAEHLARLNSATKYPSILTYHALGERGRLTEERNVSFEDVDPDDVEVTEKIDGTNTRVIIPPRNQGNILIGSRTELLHYRGDVIANPAQGIVATVNSTPVARPVADFAHESDWTVLFGEVYGGRVSSGSKNYTTRPDVTGFRLFDVARVPARVLDMDRDEIAAWRDGGGQDFARTDVLGQWADDLGLRLVPLIVPVAAPPVSVADTHTWLSGVFLLDGSFARLDSTGKGRPEGVVVRTADRSRIAKIRFEDYERTAKAGRRG